MDKRKIINSIIFIVLLLVIIFIFIVKQGKNFPNDIGYKARLHKDTIEITGYSGTDVNLIIPGEIGGFPVTYISNETFMNKAESVIIPDSVIKIGKKLHIPLLPGINNKLTKITIGQNVKIVKLGAKGSDGRFDFFRNEYDKNKKQAGTYIYVQKGMLDKVLGGDWILEK